MPQPYRIVCFDCDSTLSAIEGIDELARRSGVGEQVAELTNIAMDGELSLEAVYERRLTLIQPDRAAIDWLARRYIEELVEGAVEVIKALQNSGRQVYVISGGIRQAILPLLARLDIDADHLHAVEVYFHADGSYRGFDADSPLARSGGKAEICRQLSDGADSLVMIGDGQTDLEAKQAGAYFIGFGGVVERAAVRRQADRFVADSNLLTVLDYIPA